jgi:hypothetical protein
MSTRLSVLLALALGCSANAPGGTVNTSADSGSSTGADVPSGGGSLGSVCASICNGSGPDCGGGCVQRCQAAAALAPACNDSYLALMRCAADNGYRCPSAMMATPPPAACSAQQAAWAPCFAAALGADAGGS